MTMGGPSASIRAAARGLCAARVICDNRASGYGAGRDCDILRNDGEGAPVDEPTQRALRALGLVSGLGFAIAVPLVLLAAGGVWLDGRLGTSPLFLLVGIVLGLVSAGGLIAELLSFRSSGQGRLLRRRARRAPTDDPGAREG
jgi:ATP synthase protein I